MKTTGILYICIILTLISCEEEKIDINRFGSISGLVLQGDDYTPLEGVLVTTSPASTGVLTDENGRFNFPKVKDGEVAITARKKDYLGSNVTVSVYEDETTNVTFYLLKDEKDIGWVTIYDPVPGNGAVEQDESITFKWKVDQENKGKVLEYTVYLFESNSTVQQVAGENLTTTEVVVSDLKPDTTYFWYVVAKYEGSIVANSPTWSFKTAAEN